MIDLRAPLVLVLVSLAASAPAVTPPKQFTGGTQIVAKDVNDNFTLLANAINALEQKRPVVTHGGKSYSLDATWCAASAPTLGNLGGRAGAKTICEAACNKSPTAHMCSVIEMQRSYTLGKTTTQDGWIEGPSDAGSTLGVSDCKGWTDSSSAGTGSLGSMWVTSGPGVGFPSWAQCWSSSMPIHCCD